MELEGEAIRWTKAELLIFAKLGVSINVLEYLAAVFYVMLWADVMADSVILLECDNTAAVSWLMKCRTKGKGANRAADAIARLFTLFLLRTHIIIKSTHLRGVDNVIADFNSRDLSLCPQEADEGIIRDLRSRESLVGQWSRSCNRRELCRSILYLCVTMPERMHGQSLADALIALLSTRGSTSAK